MQLTCMRSGTGGPLVLIAGRASSRRGLTRRIAAAEGDPLPARRPFIFKAFHGQGNRSSGRQLRAGPGIEADSKILDGRCAALSVRAVLTDVQRRTPSWRKGRGRRLMQTPALVMPPDELHRQHPSQGQAGSTSRRPSPLDVGDAERRPAKARYTGMRRSRVARERASRSATTNLVSTCCSICVQIPCGATGCRWCFRRHHSGSACREGRAGFRRPPRVSFRGWRARRVGRRGWRACSGDETNPAAALSASKPGRLERHGGRLGTLCRRDRAGMQRQVPFEASLL